jgi:hypothetical protein
VVLPKTDKGWQAWLSNIRPPEVREWPSLGGALGVRLWPQDRLVLSKPGSPCARDGRGMTGVSTIAALGGWACRGDSPGAPCPDLAPEKWSTTR